MPGGRNSGAVYNLYKVKYKKHKKNNSNGNGNGTRFNNGRGQTTETDSPPIEEGSPPREHVSRKEGSNVSTSSSSYKGGKSPTNLVMKGK